LNASYASLVRGFLPIGNARLGVRWKRDNFSTEDPILAQSARLKLLSQRQLPFPLDWNVLRWLERRVVDIALELFHVVVSRDVPLCCEASSDDQEARFGCSATCSLDGPFNGRFIELAGTDDGLKCSILESLQTSSTRPK
jgi:hypothetical protein